MKVGCRHVLALFGTGCLVVGCGGGGADTTLSGDAGKASDYGPISTRAIGSVATPVVMGSRNAVFTAVFGASFSDIKVRMPAASTLTEPEVLAQTSIALERNGQPSLYDYGTATITKIGTIQYYGNSVSPSISGLGNRVAVSQEDANSKFQIFTMALDGNDRRQITSDANWAYTPAYSPDGSKILFARLDSVAGRYRIYSVGASGGVATPVSPATDNCLSPVWNSEGTKITYFDQVNGTGPYSAILANPDGSSSGALVGALNGSSAGQIAWFPGGRDYVETIYNGGTYYLWRGSVVDGGYSLLTSAAVISHVSAAPIGSNVVYYRGDNDGVYARDLVAGTETFLASGYADPAWGPYVGVRKLVGSSGVLGTAAGGFIFGQVGNPVKSFIQMDATTRSTIQVTAQQAPNPSQANAICTVSADSITSLKYLNDLRGSITTVATAASPISGAVISFNADTGRVASVVTYTGALAKASDGLTFTAKFLGAYDGLGKNRAPSGASQVTLAAQTGEIVTVH